MLSSLILLDLFRILDTTYSERPVLDDMKNIIQFLDDKYAEEINLDELAEKASYSRHHFCRIFKSQLGISPMRYLTNKRMSKAVELLTSTEIPVHDVAQKVGYANSLYFSQTFKKYYGISPKDFRDNNRK